MVESAGICRSASCCSLAFRACVKVVAVSLIAVGDWRDQFPVDASACTWLIEIQRVHRRRLITCRVKICLGDWTKGRARCGIFKAANRVFCRQELVSSFQRHPCTWRYSSFPREQNVPGNDRTLRYTLTKSKTNQAWCRRS